jgi:hypothetical protein
MAMFQRRRNQETMVLPLLKIIVLHRARKCAEPPPRI